MIEQYFQNFDIFNKEEIKEILSSFELRRLKKQSLFVQEGQACDEVAYIESGIIRSYYTTPEGADITYCFRFPNELITSYASFITGNKSEETMQVLSDATLWIIKREEINKFEKNSLAWTRFLRMIAEQQYLELEKRLFQFQRDTAGKRYESLLKEYPQYIREIPLQYLASYLGMTQRHLSRIRKQDAF